MTSNRFLRMGFAAAVAALGAISRPSVARADNVPIVIVPRGDRCVTGEDCRATDSLGSLVERETVGDVLTQTVEEMEGSVPFVAMPVGGINPEGAERSHPADAEDQFLSESVFQVAAVEP